MKALEKITSDFKFVLLPPAGRGDWYGYTVHDVIPDLDEEIWGKGSTAAKCAAELERKLREYVKKHTRK